MIARTLGRYFGEAARFVNRTIFPDPLQKDFEATKAGQRFDKDIAVQLLKRVAPDALILVSSPSRRMDIPAGQFVEMIEKGTGYVIKQNDRDINCFLLN